MEIIDLSCDTLDRAKERFFETLEMMTVEEANHMPSPIVKSVHWLVWHSAKIMDEQIAALKGSQPIYDQEDLHQAFGIDLPRDTKDWYHTPEEAKKVIITNRELLVDYYIKSNQQAKDYLKSISGQELDEIVDRSWNPPVSRGVRIVSTIDDIVMHSGQAVYTRRLVIGK